MLISLVLATNDTKIDELQRFLVALSHQTYREFELILVDQNIGNQVSEAKKEWEKNFPIKVVKSQVGLSRSRNVGLQYVQGDLIAFPDDDCWYSPYLLKEVNQHFLLDNQLDGVCGICQDGDGNLSANKWDKSPGEITKYNVWNRAVSISIFLKRHIIEFTGNFDESLGAGSGTPWGSGEETDYLIRTLHHGFKIEFFPDIVVFHPDVNYREALLTNKPYRYNMGTAKVLRKHHYPFWFVVYRWIRLIGGIMKSWFQGDPDRARFIISSLAGNIRGYMAAESTSHTESSILK
jgi:glycosyltransferase involved in cell wall biosynthesis